MYNKEQRKEYDRKYYLKNKERLYRQQRERHLEATRKRNRNNKRFKSETIRLGKMFVIFD